MKNETDYIVFVYDSTWDGMLTAVFDAFFRKQHPISLQAEEESVPLFSNVHRVITDTEKSNRVWKALHKKLSAQALCCLTTSFFSELPSLNMPLFRYLCKAINAAHSIETNFADADVLYVTNVFRKVRYERLRMMQFIRFQKTKDGTYFAMIEPDYDVLPLILPHFSDRFSQECWLIYDKRRSYGYYYENKQSVRITFDKDSPLHCLTDGRLSNDMKAEDEDFYQKLWKTYFKAICIRERLNPRKHRKDMPTRYWKYMTEKQH